jgi:hypothetical protein
MNDTSLTPSRSRLRVVLLGLHVSHYLLVNLHKHHKLSEVANQLVQGATSLDGSMFRLPTMPLQPHRMINKHLRVNLRHSGGASVSVSLPRRSLRCRTMCLSSS